MGFQRVIEILDQAIGGPDVGIGAHRAFWRGLTRDEFVAKKVFGRALVIARRRSALESGAGVERSSTVRVRPTRSARRGQHQPHAGGPSAGAGRLDRVHRAMDQRRLPGGTRPGRTHLARDQRSRGRAHAPTTSGSSTPTAAGRSTATARSCTPKTASRPGRSSSTNAGLYLRCVGFASESRGWVGTTDPGPTTAGDPDGGATWTEVTGLPDSGAAGRVRPVGGQRVGRIRLGHELPRPSRPHDAHHRRRGNLAGLGHVGSTPPAGRHLLHRPRQRMGGRRQGRRAGTAESVDPRSHIKPVVLRTPDGGRTWTDKVAPLGAAVPTGGMGLEDPFPQRTGRIRLPGELHTGSHPQDRRRRRNLDPHRGQRPAGQRQPRRRGLPRREHRLGGRLGLRRTSPKGFSSATGDGGRPGRTPTKSAGSSTDSGSSATSRSATRRG